jgi:nucleoside-diphosphate-sugar epimerase
VKELFLASSSEVYQTPATYPADERVPLVIPDPLNPRYSYGGGKIISELMAINYGRKYFQRVVIFRPHNVYGPDMGWEHVIPQFVVRMKSICQAHPDKGEIEFPIQGTGKETRAFVFIDDFINGFLISLEKGKHLEIYNIGTTEEISIGEVAVIVGQYFDRKVRIIPGETPQGSTPRRCPDISKLKKLGYLPRVSFSEGVRIAAEWYDRNAVLAPAKCLSQGEL